MIFFSPAHFYLHHTPLSFKKNVKKKKYQKKKKKKKKKKAKLKYKFSLTVCKSD